MTDLLLQRLARFFDENETAGSFLSEDGDGGYVAAVARMASPSARATAHRKRAVRCSGGTSRRAWMSLALLAAAFEGSPA